MRDSIGNKLAEGQFIYWIPKQMMCKIARVEESTLEVRKTTAKLVLEVMLEGEVAHANVEAQIPGVIRVVSPEQEEMLNKAMGGMRQ